LDAASTTEGAAAPTTDIQDPIGDTTDGEARTLQPAEPEAEAESSPAAASDPNAEETADAGAEDAADDSEDTGEEADFTPTPRPPAKLERLQKILSQAGIASRRKAEEMIEQGRVQINGTVVTELGTKADAGRDHIRVDGKLLHGAERLRYFVLNKPKGFVTTVKDPEGRPTVMQFFDKMRERLYPVGRLDYMSEGLLLVTNDGDLANKLTKAGSGVEKVYLVKVAGQPSEAELDILRGGVSIERGKPGSPQVRTSPARIRQVRQGDNPWYEVVLIEGRNRELRKMFSAVGHFVEKIRRIGYGPLVLDQEPGNMRELQPEELKALRLASEGKLRTPKAKEVRRRNLADSQLPTVQPKPSRLRPAFKPFEPKAARPSEPEAFDKAPAAAERSGTFRPKRAFSAEKPFRSAPAAARRFQPSAGRTASEPGQFRPARSARPTSGPSSSGPARPAWKQDDRAPRPPARFAAAPTGERRPSTAKPYGDRPATGRTYGAKPAARPFTGKPAAGKPAPGKPVWNKPGSSDRPPFKSPAAPRRATPPAEEEFPEIRPGGLRIDPVEPGNYEASRPVTRSKAPARPAAAGLPASDRPSFDRPRTSKPSFGKPSFERPGKPSFDKPRAGKPSFGKPSVSKPSFSKPSFKKSGPAKPGFDKPRSETPRFEKPRFEKSRFERSGPGRSSSGPGRNSEHSGGSRPPRTEGALARPFTTSSGKPRPGGARPSSKPYKPGGFSKSKPGSFSKSGPKGSGYKGKPGGAKRTGSHPGGKKRG
jgi:23S rRNA pseudouridine2605 synthase